jgi:hypothetical protein
MGIGDRHSYIRDANTDADEDTRYKRGRQGEIAALVAGYAAGGITRGRAVRRR